MSEDPETDDIGPENKREAAHFLQLWKLAESYSVREAALLIVGYDPGEFEDLERKANKPRGYVATRNSLLSALRSGSLEGEIKPKQEWQAGPLSEEPYLTHIPETEDPDRSVVLATSLAAWLTSKGHTGSLLNDQQSSAEPYRNPDHVHYAPKLAAAIDAWEAVESAPSAKVSVKQQLIKWLNENAARYGLTNDDGMPNERGIEEVAKVANWATLGGAPRSSDKPEHEE